jgi:membrane fusion protein (multidrug efflux system)
MEAAHEEKRTAGGTPRSRPALILAVIAAVALGGGFFYWWYNRGRVATDDAYVQATVYSVSARVPGKVLRVLVDDNQEVKTGQLLVQLDPEDPNLQVRIAKAGLEVAETQHHEAEIGLEAALAQNNLVKAQLDQAKLDLDRAENLLKKKAIPNEQYDRALTQHRVLSAQLQVAGAQINVARARVASASSALENAKAQLSRAELLLSYTEILAPGNGYVTKKSVREGRVVQPGEPLLAVVDLNDIWVEANFKETQLTRVRPGMRAEVEADTYSDRVFHGHVDSIMGGSGSAFSLFPPENATGNWVKIVQRIPVKIRLDDYPAQGEDMVLRVGMSADVKIQMDEKGNGHTPPPHAMNP